MPRQCLEWDSNPRLQERLELESSALDRSAIQAWHPCEMNIAQKNLLAPARPKWSIGVSIPVPRACKARTLPIELMPRLAPAGN